jgi:hypothetical protein
MLSAKSEHFKVLYLFVFASDDLLSKAHTRSPVGQFLLGVIEQLSVAIAFSFQLSPKLVFFLVESLISVPIFSGLDQDVLVEFKLVNGFLSHDHVFL